MKQTNHENNNSKYTMTMMMQMLSRLLMTMQKIFLSLILLSNVTESNKKKSKWKCYLMQNAITHKSLPQRMCPYLERERNIKIVVKS